MSKIEKAKKHITELGASKKIWKIKDSNIISEGIRELEDKYESAIHTLREISKPFSCYRSDVFKLLVTLLTIQQLAKQTLKELGEENE